MALGSQGYDGGMMSLQEEAPGPRRARGIEIRFARRQKRAEWAGETMMRLWWVVRMLNAFCMGTRCIAQTGKNVAGRVQGARGVEEAHV